MDEPIEDSRGVDVSQIRRQLRMTVAERVRSMVDAANTMMEIRERAHAGVVVRIAALDDIIESKRAANRPKDLMALPYLESLRDEIAARNAPNDG